jgi:hypothetical protein
VRRVTEQQSIIGILKTLIKEQGRSIVPLQTLAAETRMLVRQVADLVNAAYGLTRDIPNPPGPNLPGRVKGFLQMTLGAVGEAPMIASERNTP